MLKETEVPANTKNPTIDCRGQSGNMLSHLYTRHINSIIWNPVDQTYESYRIITRCERFIKKVLLSMIPILIDTYRVSKLRKRVRK